MTDATQSYANVYNNNVGFGQKPALIMIDFAHAYFDTNCPLFADVDDALESALRVRVGAHHAGIPVFLTRVIYQKDGYDGGRFFEKAKPLEAFIAGRKTAEFAKGLEPRENETIITKQYPSAFFGTSLASTLHAAKVDSVILTGLTTSGCVRASCVDSMSHGFTTSVVRQACGDRHEAPHQANLFDMNAKYADVINESDILTHMKTLT